jgi:hypothetical protein
MTVGAYLALAVGAGAFYTFLSANGGLSTEVPVRLTYEAPAWSDVIMPCIEGWSMFEGMGCGPEATPDEWPGGIPLPIHHVGRFYADVEDLDPMTAVLAGAPYWGGLVTGGLVGLVLIPALRRTASGRPFARGNARRLATAAALVALGWVVATAGPALAAPRVIEILNTPTGWLAPDPRFTWWPLLIAGLFGTLAAATHQGARVAADTEGLV